MAVSALLGAILVLGGCDGRRSEEPPSEPVAAIQFERASADPVRHGERLSLVLGCSGCHGADLKGEDWSEPGFGRLWTANLTRAAERYTEDQLEAVVRSGSKPDRTELWGMPSHLFTQLSDDDLAAVIAFLRSKPPAGDVHPPPLFEDGGLLREYDRDAA